MRNKSEKLFEANTVVSGNGVTKIFSVVEVELRNVKSSLSFCR